MTIPAAHIATPREPAQASGSAFGLQLDASFALPGLAQIPAARRVTLELDEPGGVDGVWRWADATPVMGRRFSDGRLALTIHRHDGLGYRVFGDGFGTYLISADLANIRCAPPAPSEAWCWQRFLVGHVLPLASVLNGLEVFHASAIALGDRLAAFVGSSGSGKTSLAVNMVLRGASFFTDDALALEPTVNGVVAHPGVGLASLREDQQALLSNHDAPAPGTVIGSDEESARMVLEPARRALAPTAVYFLDRRGGASTLSIREVSDPNHLLGATFNLSIRTRERLVRHLDVCQALSERTRTFELAVPSAMDAAELAAEVERHALGVDLAD